VQVADRWHLWHNLGGAVERAVARHRQHLAAAAIAPTAVPGVLIAPEPAPPAPPRRTGPIADRTRSRHADIHRLLAAGSGISEIAASLGLSRNTVRRFARAASPEELLVHDGTGRRASILDEHYRYLHERWNSVCTNAARLWQEIRDRGYQGSRRVCQVVFTAVLIGAGRVRVKSSAGAGGPSAGVTPSVVRRSGSVRACGWVGWWRAARDAGRFAGV
jgi:hypothetical protein